MAFDHNDEPQKGETAASLIGAAAVSCENFDKPTKRSVVPKQTKLDRVLRLLLSGEAWTFQSIREHGESCFHTTISKLKNSHGIEIDRDSHIINGYGGHPTRCKLYRLRRTPENLRRAHALLGLPPPSDEED